MTGGNAGQAGGDRSAESNVLCYVRGTTLSGVADGLYAVGPEDDAWPFATSWPGVGSPIYRAAAARAEEIKGTVILVPYAVGGAESGLFLQGGTLWTGLQACWSGTTPGVYAGVCAAPIPGRNGQTLNDLNGIDSLGRPRTRASVLVISQGEADADYKFGQPNAATSGDDWVLKWRTILNSLQSPTGDSMPIISSRTRIVFFEMMHGGTSGGFPGVGYPMDDRNRDLHKLLKYTSGKRHQIRIVPMEGINREENVSNPENIGSFDNLHRLCCATPSLCGFISVGQRVRVGI